MKVEENLAVDADIFSSVNKSKGDKKSKRPSTATGTIRRPGYVGISAITRESSQRQNGAVGAESSSLASTKSQS